MPSARPQASAEEARVMPPTAPLVYVYGVLRSRCDAAPRGPVGDFPLIAGSGPLRILQCGAIAALVSDVTLQEGGSPGEMLQDTQPAEEMVLNHHLVLKQVITQHTILPLRFGAMFAEDAGVIEALGERLEAFEKALDRIDGALEWSLKIFCDRESLERRLSGQVPAIRNLEGEIAGIGEGKAFFLRRRLERLVHEEVEGAVERYLNDTEERLKPHVLETAAVKIQSPESHGHAHDMVCNRAYLVARDAEDRFLGLIDDLRAAHESFGFDYKTNGPWPAYSFADCRLEGGDHVA